MRFITSALLFLSILAPAANANPVPNTDYDILIEDIEIRPGIEVDIHVEVYINENFPCRGRTFFAIHGFAHTSATWKPFAEALFDDNPTGPVVCRVAAIDLPGRGGSSLPDGLAFGDLFLDDHVTAILSTLDELRNRGVRPRTVVAHSQGGLLTQMAQQRLIDSGTNLRREHRIRRAILLAPVGPVQIPWLFVDSGVGGQLIAQFLTVDPVLGTVISIPDAAFPGLFFTDLMGVPAAGTPSPQDVTDLGYNSPEPLLATLQLVGEPPLTRPTVSARAFANWRGTRLSIATFEQDILIRPDENALLYEHLTGKADLQRLAIVPGSETVHDMYIADPARLLAEVAGTIRF